jgi:hypothetical protein
MDAVKEMRRDSEPMLAEVAKHYSETLDALWRMNRAVGRPVILKPSAPSKPDV